MTAVDVKGKTDDELAELAQRINREQIRRKRVATGEQTVSEMNRKLLDESGIVEGDEWVQPTSVVGAYPRGWTVTHGGKTWTSLTSANVWEPGVANWREITDDGSPAEWAQPSDAEDAYKIGDRVTFNGDVYESVIDANTWSPADYPQGWQLVK